MNTGNLSNLFSYWTSGVFSHTGPLVLWCVVLIVVGFKGIKYRKKMMVSGVWFYALSIVIPVIQYVLYEIMAGSSLTERSADGPFLRHTAIITGVLTQLAAAAAIAYPLLAIFTTDQDRGPSPQPEAERTP
jgi:hypothetical protein